MIFRPLICALKQWSESTTVSFVGRARVNQWAAECPHVVARHGKYYLFRTQRYGQPVSHRRRSGRRDGPRRTVPRDHRSAHYLGRCAGHPSLRAPRLLPELSRRRPAAGAAGRKPPRYPAPHEREARSNSLIAVDYLRQFRNTKLRVPVGNALRGVPRTREAAERHRGRSLQE